jgi:hypothetical protein
MPNQALEMHRVSARCFDLAGIRTGSIRDQLLRSSVIVNALDEEGLIGRGRPLLVCGAGAAGMNAAIVAGERGVQVTVLERAPQPFDTIYGSYRSVDPTEYDWPHRHWTRGRFPVNTGYIRPKDIALRQPGPGYASSLCSAWYQHWLDYVARSKQDPETYGRVDLRTGVVVKDLNFRDPGAGHHVDVSGYWTAVRDKVELKSFGAVLSCVGHGEERLSDPGWRGYKGMRFWQDSDGIRPGVPLPPGLSRIVVSGGGDGAMQDIQRFLTSYCGRQLYEKLEQAGVAPDADMLMDLLSTEESARRRGCWVPAHRANDALLEWHAKFELLVDAQFREIKSTNPQLLDDAARQILRNPATDTRPELWWIYRESSPGHAYALNRYLVLFLIRLIKETAARQSPVTVIPDITITGIAGEYGHVCTDPFDCLGEEHKLTIEGGPPPELEGIHLIAIRHGIKPSDAIFRQRLSLADQLSPFELPPL